MRHGIEFIRAPPPCSRIRHAAQAAAALRKLVPLGDRVLVKRVVQEARTAGGIFLPETGKKLNEGEVLAVGPGTVTRDGKVLPMHVKAGDKVLLPEYGGHTVKIGEEELTIYREDDILGKFDGQLK